MKNPDLMKVMFVLSFVLLFSVSVTAQTRKQNEIKQIEAYSKSLDAFLKKNKNRHPVFADVSDPTKDTNASWRRYSSVSAFEKASPKIDPAEIVYVWQKGNKIVMANFSLFTPSGDWALFTNHYFREDGTLAKVESQLNTFALEGPLSVIRDYYFDRKGKLLQKTTKYYDRETKKTKKAGQVNFFDREAEIFKTTGKLPFIL